MKAWRFQFAGLHDSEQCTEDCDEHHSCAGRNFSKRCRNGSGGWRRFGGARERLQGLLLVRGADYRNFRCGVWSRSSRFSPRTALTSVSWSSTSTPQSAWVWCCRSPTFGGSWKNFTHFPSACALPLGHLEIFYEPLEPSSHLPLCSCACPRLLSEEFLTFST